MPLGIAAGGCGVNSFPPLVEHFLTTGGVGGGVTSVFTPPFYTGGGA